LRPRLKLTIDALSSLAAAVGNGGVDVVGAGG
jgi:hypothetical protein